MLSWWRGLVQRVLQHAALLCTNLSRDSSRELLVLGNDKMSRNARASRERLDSCSMHSLS